MNPLRYLRPAVYAALTSPALQVGGNPVSVVAYGQPTGGAALYLLLNPDQDTSNKTIDGARCKQWDCTVLVDVVNIRPADALSVALSDELADVVTTALDSVRFALPQALQILKASVENINGGTGYSGEQPDIHRYLRVRYTISFNL